MNSHLSYCCTFSLVMMESDSTFQVISGYFYTGTPGVLLLQMVLLRVPYYGESNRAPMGTVLVLFFLSVVYLMFCSTDRSQGGSLFKFPPFLFIFYGYGVSIYISLNEYHESVSWLIPYLHFCVIYHSFSQSMYVFSVNIPHSTF